MCEDEREGEREEREKFVLITSLHLFLFSPPLFHIISLSPSSQDGQHTQSLLSLSGLLQGALASLRDGLTDEVEKYRKVCVCMCVWLCLNERVRNFIECPKTVASIECTITFLNSNYQPNILSLSSPFSLSLPLSFHLLSSLLCQTDVVGILKGIAADGSSKSTPLHRELEWFAAAMGGETSPQIQGVMKEVAALSHSLDMLISPDSTPSDLIQGGRKAAAEAHALSKWANEIAAQCDKKESKREIGIYADSLRNVGTQLKILSCLAASGGGGEGDREPALQCSKTMEALLMRTLNEIQIAHI